MSRRTSLCYGTQSAPTFVVFYEMPIIYIVNNSVFLLLAHSDLMPNRHMVLY